ncbi:hypothetical protein [Bradyrhizobium sp. LHD-71]|uniref:hypothetical protein n=1 Tax=Bradyrhizobium sp. LHD-71 TaxID=3072141 RepID=UPI00280D8759|nr:hypothetical protein [Bradyrhizobium sp. LHD-71]MDQ8730487.1 hypothetical protein [Bradyrhizobium sp. LHD-71]
MAEQGHDLLVEHLARSRQHEIDERGLHIDAASTAIHSLKLVKTKSQIVAKAPKSDRPLSDRLA